ncbi:MAG: S1 RNA-binding domain-containing protein [Chitinivibrionales bacterium]|nr:S1 RNA-binding domain-containing protein [Chitinivibrionales bacterium]
MVEFSTYVAKKWDISDKSATIICQHFESGDSYFYTSDYDRTISAELDLSIIYDIFQTLKDIQSLGPKKKRIISSIQKLGSLDEELEHRINLCTSDIELDDIMAPFRHNPRSRGFLALQKGLGPIIEFFEKQEVEKGTLDEYCKKFIAAHANFTSVEEVLADAKEVLVERYFNDETVRSMVREIGLEDGFFEVIPRAVASKKDKRFTAFRGKLITVTELVHEDFLKLMEAEKEKSIRFKHGVQLFHISELLRHHFIENPDFIGYDFLCEVCDECWSRLLQPYVEEYVKSVLNEKAQRWALTCLDDELLKKHPFDKPQYSIIVIGKNSETSFSIIALNSDGNLLGATDEQESDPSEKDTFSARLIRFVSRYKPAKIVAYDNAFYASVEEAMKKALKNTTNVPVLEKFILPADNASLLNSEWMKQRCAMLNDSMKDVYANGIRFLQPFSVIGHIGMHHFSLHPLQQYVNTQRLAELIVHRTTDALLHKGIPIQDVGESVLSHFSCVTPAMLSAIRKEHTKKPLNMKLELTSVEGVPEVAYRNIAGYIVFPASDSILDHTLVHPHDFTLIQKIADELEVTIEMLVSDPESAKTFQTNDFAEKFYIDQRIPKQLWVANLYPLPARSSRVTRRLPLTELREGSVLQGRVTNITKFGVFVDVNAVCDGLIHISQLTNEYIETPDQVVSPNELVTVCILKVDKKKRRISLSMKKATVQPAKVKPSKGQLSNLAEHFKNR